MLDTSGLSVSTRCLPSPPSLIIGRMLRPVADASVADWIMQSIHAWGQDVGSIVPEGFEAYARVFHPAGEGDEEWNSVRWADIARANGNVAHSEMQFKAIVPRECFDERGLNWRKGQPGIWDWPPEEGELPEELGAALASALSLYTNTPEHCFFAYWNGSGDPSVLMPPPRNDAERAEQERVYESYRTGEVFRGTPREFRDVAGRFSIPDREYFLYEGAVTEVTTDWDGTGGGQLPAIWWPEDRAWCVAGDTDLDSTYVGGTRSCIASLMTLPEIEALPTQVSSGIGSDAVN